MPPEQQYNSGTEGKITVGDIDDYNASTEKVVRIAPIATSSNFAALNFEAMDAGILDFTNLT